MALIKTYSLEKHIKGHPHQFAERLAWKELLGPLYHEKVVSNMPIGRVSTKMQEEDKQVSQS